MVFLQLDNQEVIIMLIFIRQLNPLNLSGSLWKEENLILRFKLQNVRLFVFNIIETDIDSAFYSIISIDEVQRWIYN